MIENVRCFGEQQELKLVNSGGGPARWTLIVGDNGVGKTTLLQCLARMRPKFNPPSDEESERPPNPVEPELAAEDNEVLQALTRAGSDVPVRLAASLSVGEALGTGPVGRSADISTSISITRADGRIANIKPGGQGVDPSSLAKGVEEPLVLGYGASRRPSIADVDKDTPTGPVESLFKDEAPLHDAELLLSQLDHLSLKERRGAADHLAGMKTVLSAILPDVEGSEGIDILGPPRVPGVPAHETGIHVKTPYGTVPLSQLSLGYRTVFAWTVDIAWRLLQRNPTSADPFLEPAIVIVDEIDLHLHPSWQRDIREHLTGHFPNVQFIATAHGPLMAQTSLDANLAVVRLSGDHAVIDNDPAVIQNWRLDQLITSDLFELSSARSPWVEKWQERRSELLGKAALSPEEAAELEELDRMALQLPTMPPEDERAMEIIRRAAEGLQTEKGTQ